jgi:uncharacterized membrane protein
MVNNQGLAEHHASVTVNAPVHQVYGLFTHFNDFPKFMSFVKEVTYYDDVRSHWVAEVVGQHEWDAVNETWVEDQQIGWRSTSGLENMGKVTFQPIGADQTLVDVFIYYNPPAGVLGDVGEKLGAGSRFDSVLQHDLDNFARMVNAAPPGALDPNSSNYLFHSGSAAAGGKTTDRQDATMYDDNQRGSDYVPGTAGTDYSAGATDRPVLDRDIISGQYDRGTGTTQNTIDSPIPSGTESSSPEMPSNIGTSNSVMPPERSSQ